MILYNFYMKRYFKYTPCEHDKDRKWKIKRLKLMKTDTIMPEMKNTLDNRKVEIVKERTNDLKTKQ